MISARKGNAARQLALVRALNPGLARVYSLPDGRRYALISAYDAPAPDAQVRNLDALETSD